jgi:hypothetical protein
LNWFLLTKKSDREYTIKQCIENWANGAQRLKFEILGFFFRSYHIALNWKFGTLAELAQLAIEI